MLLVLLLFLLPWLVVVSFLAMCFTDSNGIKHIA